eukprot:scaffold43348_cov65-Phaeocystis_antarctica.AAC.9
MRLEVAKQLDHSDSSTILKAVTNYNVEDVLLHVWSHACGQPRGVQWGTWMRHHRKKLSAATGSLPVATPHVHGSPKEQCAELQGVLPAHLSVDVEGGGR